jgi:serine/threonine protein kinase
MDRRFWSLMSQVLYRETISKDIVKINVDINQCVTDLQLNLMVENEIQRIEDISDFKTMFKLLSEKMVEEMRQNNDNNERRMSELKECIDSTPASLSKIFRDVGHPDLSREETENMRSYLVELNSNIDAKFDEIRSGVRALMEGMTRIEKFNRSTEETNSRRRVLDSFLLHSSKTTLTHVIGGGGFGCVYMGKYNKQNVAIKVVKSDRGGPLSKQQKEEIENEVLIMSQFRDPNILTCYGFCHDPDQSIIVMDLASFGALSESLYDHTTFPSISLVLLIAWICDIGNAVAAISRRRIVHKDIKAENILLFHDLSLKICDFGLSKQSSSVTGAVSKLGAGTLAFLAPEILMYGHSSYESDVFSFAVTMVQVLLRTGPDRRMFRDQTAQAFDWSADPEGSDACMVQANSSLSLLCSDMLQAEPSHRPAIYKIAEQLDQIQQLIGGDPRDSHTEDPRITAFRDAAVLQQRIKLSAMNSTSVNTSSSTTEVDSYFIPSSVSSQSIGKLPPNLSASSEIVSPDSQVLITYINLKCLFVHFLLLLDFGY